MAQFDVFRNPRRGAFPVPARRADGPALGFRDAGRGPDGSEEDWRAARLSRLNPIATVNRVEYVLVFQEMAAVSEAMLGEPVVSLASRRVDLIAALDVLFTGV